MTYRDRMRKTLTGRAGDWLSRNSFPRLIVLGAYFLGALGAFGASYSTVAWGIKSLPVRFGLSFAAGYMVYAILMSAWLLCTPSLEANELMTGASDNIETVCPTHVDDDWIHGAVESGMEAVARQPRSLMALVFVVAILGIFFLMAHWMWYARWYLGDLLVRSGRSVHRSMANTGRETWVVAPIRQSFWIAFGLFGHFVLLGSMIQFALQQRA